MINQESRQRQRWIGGSALAFCLAALLLPLAGPAPLDLARVWTGEEPDRSILVHLRVPRTLLGLFGGAALALAGSLFQSMLRDPLATPYTLGVSTGASLCAVLAIAFGGHVVAGVPGVWAGALAGAAVVLLLVVLAATRQRQVSAVGLLLAGVATNSVCSALILLVHGLAGMSDSFAISRWLIGSLDAVEYPALLT
ncbi:MAG: iron chelate uptake ABC transporter family permease subunit, partial [Vicinamibacterales bacterium]